MKAWTPHYKVELCEEEDGRWLADIPSMPGVMAYGATPEQAVANVIELADGVRQN